MAKLFNRAKMTTSTTGSGTVTLGGASVGYQSFADAGVSNGDVVQYVIEEGSEFEIGTGTYSATGTSLTRSPTESSNSGAAISLSGAATVSITAVADDLNRLQHEGSDKVTVSSTGASVTGNISVTGTVDGRDVASDGSKLDGIEANADVTDTANVTAAGALMDSEVANLAQVKAFDSSDYATAAQGTKADNALPKSGGTMTGAITFASGQTFDGRDVSADGSKLDGIESGATADQTAAEIRSLVESATDSNVFTDADHTKLNGIEAGAEVNDPAFKNIAVSGQSTVVADADADTLNLAAGSNVTITTDASTDTVTIASTDTNTVPNNATITISAGDALTGGGNFTTDQASNETITINHQDTSSQASVNNSGRTYIQDITLDGYGHVTGISSATETVVNTNTNQLTTFQVEDGDGTEVTISHGKEWKFVEGTSIDINWTDTSTGSDGDPYDLTISHSDTSTLSGTYGSTGNGTKIDQITVDAQGHVTAITTGATGSMSSFNVQANSGTQVAVSNGEELNFIDGNATTVAVTNQNNPTVQFNHSDTSSQASVNNSGGTVIQDVTLDTYGHVTGLTSYNLDGRYYTETEANGRYFRRDTSNNVDVRLASANGRGLRFWDSDNYKIWMSNATDATWGGRLDSTSDYNMYFRMTGGTNRGFVFQNSTTEVFQVESGGQTRQTGAAYVNTNQRVFADNYHPNADKWTTARTLSLSGQASGSVSWDGSANATLSVTLNDSALDDQYVTVGSRHTGNADTLVEASKASIRLWDVSTATDDPSGSNDGLVLSAGWDSTSWGVQQYHDFHNNDLYLRSKQNGTFSGWEKVWSEGNDGAGSGLDADKLDGYHESTFMRRSANSQLDMNNYNIVDVEDIGLQDRIYHDGDTDTFMQFNAANSWRVVTGNNPRLTVTSSTTTVENDAVFNGEVSIEDPTGIPLDVKVNTDRRILFRDGRIDAVNASNTAYDAFIFRAKNTYIQDDGGTIRFAYTVGNNRVECTNGSGSRGYTGYILTTPNDSVANAIRANGYIEWQTDVGAIGTSYFLSDVSLKENISASTTVSSDLINDIDFIQFDWKPESGNEGHVDVGVSAQQLQEVDARLVNELSDGRLMVNEPALVAHLGKALQEALAKIDALETRIEALEA